MPNKRVVIIFSVLLALAVIVVLACTLFNLKEIQIEFSGGGTENLNSEELLKSAERYKGHNLLFLSEKRVAESVGASSPYVSGVDVERVFPGKVILHVRAREELFVMKLSDSEYYVFDSTGFALRKTTVNEDNSEQKKRNVFVSGVTESEIAVLEVGKSLQLKDARKLSCIVDIFDTLMRFEEPDTYTPGQIKDFFMEIDVSNLREVSIVTKYNNGSGVKIRLDESLDKLPEQVALAVGIYNGLKDFDRGSGVIRIWEDKSNSYGFSGAYTPAA